MYRTIANRSILRQQGQVSRLVTARTFSGLARTSFINQQFQAPRIVFAATKSFTQTNSLHSSSISFSTGFPGKKWEEGKDVSYDELRPITQHPSDDILLIDVREPDEVLQGNIPSSVNVPLSGLERAWNMDDGDFTRTYGFKKPRVDQPIIMYCRSGKRSASAIEIAKNKGYKFVRNYPGSYLEWNQRQGTPDEE